MEIRWLIYVLVIGFMSLVAWNILRGGGKKGVKVFVLDTFGDLLMFNGVKLPSGKIKWRYNAASKAGVSYENNEFKFRKKRAYIFEDQNDTLLPVGYKKAERILQLSTSQEKLYEIDAKKAIVDKIDSDSFWDKNKPFFYGIIMIFAAAMVSAIMLNFSFDVQPVPQPQIQLASQCMDVLQNVSATNSEEFKQTLQELQRLYPDVETKVQQQIPK